MASEEPTAYTPLNGQRPQGGLRAAASSRTPSNSYQAIPIIDRSIPKQKSTYFSALATPNTPSTNSMSGFANSYHRAHSFRSIAIDPRITASRSVFKDDEELIDPDTFAPSPLGRKISTVFGAKPILNNLGNSDDVFDDDDSSLVDHSFTDYVISRQPSVSSSVFQSSGDALSRVISHDVDSIIVRQVETDEGTKLTMIAPQSTVPQTIFNCINALIGIGLLALSRAMVHAGLLCGTIFLLYSVAITYWTATLLSDCMDTDPTLCTYADLGYKSYGPKARLGVSILFTVELLGVGVSLIVLFADSLHAMFPEISLNAFKWIGSLVDPVPFNIYPISLKNLFLSYGIILGPFGSHSLFPALKADLSQPHKFKSVLKTTYSVGFFADGSMAMLGFFMFGAGLLNEITQSVLVTPGYPKFVYFLISMFVSLIPVAKTPINALPIINITEFLFGLTPQQLEYSGKSNTLRTKLSIFSVKVGVNLMFVICAILYPEFDRIIGLSGSSLCTLICIVLPCAFYLKLCKPKNKWLYYTIMTFALIFGAISTYAAIAL
ncbi:unnamed protein product [Pichia kudriavzevii]